MSPSTFVLNRQLLRLAKGLLKAYEAWLNDQRDDDTLARLKATRRTMTANKLDE